MVRQQAMLPMITLVLAISLSAQTAPRQTVPFSDSWKFYRGDASGANQASFSDNAWETVCLPHSARIESAKTHTNWNYYQGYCWYRKSFTPPASFQGKKVFLEIEAGMQTTQVWINGTSKLTYGGGYSPFTIDITGDLLYSQTNVIAMRLNNAADPNVPPGAEQRDFYYYGGLYRYVNLHVVDSLHITDAVYANLPANGGVFVTYPTVNTSTASVRVQTHIKNESASSKSVALATTLIDPSGNDVQTLTATKTFAAGANDTFVQIFAVTGPRLWSPQTPNLYTVRSRVSDNTRLADEQRTTIGIRHLTFSRNNGFQINGSRMKSKGMNRHQDYGAIGGAVPVSGHYRDALRMKEAGINFIRLSHYIQHPSFLDACDKLGITVQACMPGWQVETYSNATWVANAERDLRTMIRYYRNHPCVIMWEAVHNESSPPATFSNRMQAAAHQEFPGNQMFTCGQETGDIMDIYQAAVQQGGRTARSSGKPQAISEYGHWEWGGFTVGGTSSNQPRSIGEAGMLTLAGNHASAMSQDHALSWLSVDALWVYNETFGFTQYNNSLCGGGIVDVFRIPKFSYYFYQAQRDTAVLRIPGTTLNSGPMVYIANFYTSTSPTTVRVFSNCSQVRLSRNGTVVATQSPGTLANIDHPPFTFNLGTFQSGTLLAEGLIGGVVRATHQVRTPGAAARVAITIDTANLSPVADGADLALVYASIVDANGTVIPNATNAVTFSVSGPGAIISGDGNPTTAVAGIAAAYVQTRLSTPGLITVTAAATGLTSGSSTVRSVPMPENPFTAVSRPAVTIPPAGRGQPVIVLRGRVLSLREG
ncbi:MAG: hypothetical protein JXA71_10975, partial [Chitinispirillaceae bacterium]|nr:hypothetical protein [Chitinispirillaceae bacterium]